MAAFKQTLVILVCMSVQYFTYACPNGCSCPTTSTSVSCSNLARFPNTSFPKNMTTLQLRYSNKLIVPTYGFNEYSDLKTISFSYGSVDRINSDAFAKLSVKKIQFERVDVNVIDGNAFRNLEGNMDVIIVFRYGNIDTIDSYAFNGIRGMWEMQFDHMKIKEIKPFAFNDISLCYTLSFRYCTITHLKSYAFNFPDNAIKVPRMDGSTLINIGCKTVEKFQLNSLTTICDCGLASLYKRGVSINGNPVECLSPDSQMEAVPYSMFECNRPDIKQPAGDESQNIDGYGYWNTEKTSFLDFLQRLHLMSRKKSSKFNPKGTALD